jgi:hypothetical protein
MNETTHRRMKPRTPNVLCLIRTSSTGLTCNAEITELGNILSVLAALHYHYVVLSQCFDAGNRAGMID